ncbi:MAG: lysophospholipid acyltransferase family protein [Chthoniobacterales bacterium]
MNKSGIHFHAQVVRSSPNEQLFTPPKISRRLLALFGGYSEKYLRRHFHSVRLLANSAPPVCEGLPLIIYLNHSSWWDPLVCLLLARRFFPKRNSYGPMDARALRRYQFFRRLGFFGVEAGSVAGAKDFLEAAEAILQAEDSALWITPQGRFVDFHARPVRLERGISHLTRHAARAAFVPLAVQYSFWEERLPEVLVAFGEPVIFQPNQSLRIGETTRLFESALESVQDHLATAAQRRRGEDWRPLLEGAAGTSIFYDLWRRARARLRGEHFRSAHSEK